MDNKDIITSIILFLSPAVGIILSTTSLLNIGKKDLSDFFEKIKKYIQKRKVENLSKVIFPESIGLYKNEDGIVVNGDALKNLSKEIDDISVLEKCLFYCKKYNDYLFYSFFVIIFVGVVHFILSFVGVSITFVNDYFLIFNIFVVVYVFMGIFILIHKKNKLEKLYEKEYDI